MAATPSVTEQIVAAARKLIEPQDRKCTQTFQNLVRKLRYDSTLKEWQFSEAVEKTAGDYISARIRICSDAIARVANAMRLPLAAADILDAFAAVFPDEAELKRFLYQTAQGLSFPTGPGFGIAIDDAFRNGRELESAELELLAYVPGGSGGERKISVTSSAPDFSRLTSDAILSSHLQVLCSEAIACYSVDANLATVVMLGSLLEGVLLAKCKANEAIVASSNVAPRKQGLIRPFSEWSLANLIDVAAEQRWIHQSRSDFSDVLRDYRNYVHPERAAASGYAIDKGAARVSWQVAREVLNDLGVSADFTPV
jgi:hypothetical protein